MSFRSYLPHRPQAAFAAATLVGAGLLAGACDRQEERVDRARTIAEAVGDQVTGDNDTSEKEAGNDSK
jgi:hypothetical protein